MIPGRRNTENRTRPRWSRNRRRTHAHPSPRPPRRRPCLASWCDVRRFRVGTSASHPVDPALARATASQSRRHAVRGASAMDRLYDDVRRVHERERSDARREPTRARRVARGCPPRTVVRRCRSRANGRRSRAGANERRAVGRPRSRVRLRRRGGDGGIAGFRREIADSRQREEDDVRVRRRARRVGKRRAAIESELDRSSSCEHRCGEIYFSASVSAFVRVLLVSARRASERGGRGERREDEGDERVEKGGRRRAREFVQEGCKGCVEKV